MCRPEHAWLGWVPFCIKKSLIFLILVCCVLCDLCECQVKYWYEDEILIWRRLATYSCSSRILLHQCSFIWDGPADIWIFYRGACTFRSMFAILTPPPILDISAPFAISEVSINNGYLFYLFMTHKKPQLPTHRNHWVTVSQSQMWLKADLPCSTTAKALDRVDETNTCFSDFAALEKSSKKSCPTGEKPPNGQDISGISGFR